MQSLCPKLRSIEGRRGSKLLGALPTELLRRIAGGETRTHDRPITNRMRKDAATMPSFRLLDDSVIRVLPVSCQGRSQKKYSRRQGQR